MRLQDLWIDVAVGEEKIRSRRVEIRASRRITCTAGFDIEKLRAEAHMVLDAELDELSAVITLAG